MNFSILVGRSAWVLLLALLAACAPKGLTRDDQRNTILDMRQEVLTELYEEKPSVRDLVASSPGYAVFDNGNVNLILASFGGGYGVVEERANGQRTYMKMGEVGIGLGLGVKDYRIVFIFHTPEALEYFVEKGWSFGGQADAAAKAGDKGGAAGREIVTNNVTIYQLTESGLALQATVKGTKYWRDDELN